MDEDSRQFYLDSVLRVFEVLRPGVFFNLHLLGPIDGNWGVFVYETDDEHDDAPPTFEGHGPTCLDALRELAENAMHQLCEVADAVARDPELWSQANDRRASKGEGSAAAEPPKEA